MYIVIAPGEEFTSVADGLYRLLSYQKRKRNKHLRYFGVVELNDDVTDVQIKKLIKDAVKGRENIK